MSAPIPPWEPLSEPILADQRGTYDRMRAACPVAESPRGVTLFRHADVVAAASDPATFSSAASAHRMVPNALDPPEHTAFRAIIDPFFAADRMAALEPRVRRIATQIVNALPRELNLVFGTGIHVCPGRPLATMELVVATETLLEATARIDLASNAAPVRETYPLGGWERVPVRLR